MDPARLHFNGIDARSGRTLTEPMTLADVAELAVGAAGQPRASGLGWRGWLAAIRERLGGTFLGLPFGCDPLDLADAGWGIVFHADESPGVRTALEPLIEHRRLQAGERLRVFVYRPGDTCRSWLADQGVVWGSVRPERIPYYLLLVGGPDRIPFDFQFQLVDYAVGRLALDDPGEYRTYAEGLAALGGAEPHPPSAAVFAPRLDPATELTERLLAGPLATALAADAEVTSLRAADATRDALRGVLAPSEGRRGLDLLFAASHGVRWPPEDGASQRDWQGALLCEGWHEGEAVDPERHLFGAGHVGDDARIHGLLAFLFACDGAGTSEFGSPRSQGKKPPRLAERPFVSALARRLLAHSNGSAQAVIGHVDQVWSFSFASPETGEQIQPFTNTVRALLAGETVGHALRDFRDRYGALAVEVDRLLRPTVDWGLGLPDRDREPLARAWLERNDAEGWIVLGDPASRLAVRTSSGDRD